jgi:hypothetical protein
MITGMRDEDTSRWAPFTDEELAVLVGYLGEGESELLNEVEEEYDRRYAEREAPTYRGPGFYVDVRNGTSLHVVGRVTVDGVRCVLVGSSLEDLNLWTLPADRLEVRLPDGRRAFRYEEYS